MSAADRNLPNSDETYNTVFNYESNSSVHPLETELKPIFFVFDPICQLQRVAETKIQHLIKYLETEK